MPKIIFVMMLGSVLSAVEFAQAGSFPFRKNIIDVHAHVACFGYQSECFISDRMKSKWQGLKFATYKKIFGIREEVLKREGDAYLFRLFDHRIRRSRYVRSAVFLSFDWVYSLDGKRQKKKSEIYVPNDFVAAAAKKYETILYAASVHPYRKDALEELERVKKQGAVFVKLIPSIQLFDPAHPKVIPYYRKLVELNLPLLIHLDDEGSFSHQAEQYSGPHKIERALQLGVQVIAAHVASKGHSHVSEEFQEAHMHSHPGQQNSVELSNFEQLTLLARRYPNLYADISALPAFGSRMSHLKKVLAEPVWEGRLLYGSDFPLDHKIFTSMNYFPGLVFSPYYRKLLRASREGNRWDYNVLLKKALGAPDEIFELPSILLGQNRSN